MPFSMIHLLVARAVEPGASAAFWVGNVAPDYASDRDEKDRVHLRGCGDRWAALAGLRGRIDFANPFERGWLLHLFTDACWEEGALVAFRNWAGCGEDWFPAYREESGRAAYFLYHALPWAKEVMEIIGACDLDAIETCLPLPRAECAWYRDRVVRKHRESDPACVPRFFTRELLFRFAQETAERYRDWADRAE